MDLFDYSCQKALKKESPLASRIRPETVEEFVGQQHIVGKGKLLYRAIKADRITSIIFYGPPGTGKTTLAKIIANSTSSEFVQLNATTSGVKDIKDVVEKAKMSIGMYNKKTILFIDEIHRFNKLQQDSLLPYVEDGTLILIGATTENPYFEVNRALVSRSTLFELKPLSTDDIKKIILNALNDSIKGLGSFDADITEDALEFLADSSNGDSRVALNSIEIAVLTTERSSDSKIHIDIDTVQECIQKRAVSYDISSHYDTISAFIKSMRGSDPDAALYYLARMLYAGEDIKFIARRIVICASEDVGNADPNALQVAVAAAQAVEFIGMPESRIILAQAVTYVSCAPKSNSTIIGIDRALEDVKNIQIDTIPEYLRDSHYKLSDSIEKYKYVHDYPNHYIKQQYIPNELVGKVYYNPSENGKEKKIKEFLDRVRNIQ